MLKNLNNAKWQSSSGSISLILQLALKEIRNHRRFSFFFVISVFFGLLGLTGIETFKGLVESNLQSRSKELLGADLEISSRFPIKKEQVDQVQNYFPKSTPKTSLSLFSMTSFNNLSRLIQIRAQDDGYPFYGVLVLGSGAKYPGDADRLKEDEVWIYPEIANQLGVKIGDIMPIGNSEYKVKDIVEQDVQQSMQTGAIAPRVYMSMEGIDRGKLIQFGSTVSYKVGFKFSDVQVVDDYEDKIDQLKKSYDPTVRVSTPTSEEDQVGRTLAYLGDFLGLVSLVAMFLASVGIIYLYQAHLRYKAYDFTVLHAIGMPRFSIFKFSLIHLIILSVVGTLLSLLFGLVLIPPLKSLSASFLPIALEDTVSIKPFFIVAFVGILSPLLLAFPLAKKAIATATKSKLSLSDKISWIGWPIFFCILSFYVAQSYIVSGAFLGAIILFLLIVLPILRLTLKFLEGLTPKNIMLRHTILRCSRSWASTSAIILSIFYCSLVFNLIPQLRVNLENEISVDDSRERPSLFLFDIQEDQVEGLRKFSKENNLPLKNMSPMVRARLVSINDDNYEVELDKGLTREEEQNARFRNRGMNLSYAKGLNPSEKMLEGEEFSGQYSDPDFLKPAEISIETRFAARIGIKIGDLLEFDVLGMPIKGIVKNIRSVRWTSFMPNFFITFQEGFLNDAPKTFLATFGHLEDKDKDQIQTDLYKSFPNVSAVDVGRVVERIVVVLGTMSKALLLMSMLTVVVGLLVIGFIINHQLLVRQKDIALEKMLGISKKDLLFKVRLEFLGIIFSAAACGVLCSLAMSYALSFFLFDGLWAFDIQLPVISLFAITAVGAITVELIARKSVNTQAAVLFRDSD